MLAIERRSQILSELEAQKRVLVPDLAKKYKVTEETIRRDLEKLEKEGLLKKTYGGAVLSDDLSSELPYRVRVEANKAQKIIIAEKIQKLIKPTENIMLDASSTCVNIARKLKTVSNLTIITNSVEILMEYSNCGSANVISTGGTLRDFSLSLVGSGAVGMISQFMTDKAIISCKGLDFDKGIMESSLAEVEIKQAMVANTKQVILALDSSKFNRLSFAKTLDLRRVHLVVSDNVPREWARFFEENNIKFL